MTVLFLTIDPGHKECGLATRWQSGGNIGSHHLPLSELSAQLNHWKGAWNIESVVALVERSRCTIPRFRAHRAAANACIKAIKMTWPRRNKVITIGPQDWQRRMIKNCPGKDTKERSLFRAILDGYTGDNHNEADAWNMLTLLMAQEGMK
jgi:hypothetical protein